MPSASAVQVDVFGWTLGTMSVRGLLALVAVCALVTGAAAAAALSLLVAWQRDRTRLRLALAEDDRRLEEARTAQREYLAQRRVAVADLNGHGSAQTAAEEPPATEETAATEANDRPPTDEAPALEVRDQTAVSSEPTHNGAARNEAVTGEPASTESIPTEPVQRSATSVPKAPTDRPDAPTDRPEAARMPEANTLLVVDDEADEMAPEERPPAGSVSDALVLLPEPPDDPRS